MSQVAKALEAIKRDDSNYGILYKYGLFNPVEGENQSEAPFNHTASCLEPCHNGHSFIDDGDPVSIFRYGQG